MSQAKIALKKSHLEDRQRPASVSPESTPRPTVKLYSPEVSPSQTDHGFALGAVLFVAVVSCSILYVHGKHSSNSDLSEKPESNHVSSPRTEPTVQPPQLRQSNPVEDKVYVQVVELPGMPKLTLNGIVWSGGKPLAIINNIEAAPGDDIGDVTVVAIRRRRVKLRAQSKEFFVRLP